MDKFIHLSSNFHKFRFVPVSVGDNEEAQPEAWNVIGGDRKLGVVFVDHRPRKQRIKDIIRLQNRADVLVIHDAEDQSYDYEPALTEHFPYRHTFKDLRVYTTVVSKTQPNLLR